MVIATQTVNKTIKKSRTNSFVSSYKMLVKEIKSRIAMEGLGEGDGTVECEENACYENYDISKDDYGMSVSKNETSYIFALTGKGKFDNMSLGDEKDVECPVINACTGSKTITVKIDEDGKVTSNE